MSSNNYTCIFGGGAIRGMAYVGAMQALNELGIHCEKFVGSSVGAIFASFYSMGFTPEEVKAIMLDFNAFMFKDINFGRGTDFALSKGDVFEKWIREILEKKYYQDKYKAGENPPITFRHTNIPLYICSTDLATNTQFTFSETNTPDFEIAKAVRISSCFPGLMKPVEYEGKVLVDGDLAKSLPLWKCSDELVNKDNRILEYRLEGTNNISNIKTPVDYFNAVYSTISKFSTIGVFEQYQNQDKIDYIEIDTQDLLLLDFQISKEERERISKLGYDTTMKYFKSDILEKKQLLLQTYTDTLTMLSAIKNLIKNNKINLIRETLVNYICNVGKHYNCMDFVFLEDLNVYKDAIFKDIKRHNILPVLKFDNQTEHIKRLQAIIENCENKINEINEYINKYSN